MKVYREDLFDEYKMKCGERQAMFFKLNYKGMYQSHLSMKLSEITKIRNRKRNIHHNI